MAKRKRLSPADLPPLANGDPEDRRVDPVAPFAGPGAALRRPAPIADVAGHAATEAAATEMADALRAAREEGRMILSLPLETVDEGYLVRDRTAVDEGEMTSLMESLRSRGQQTPVEVAALDPGRYGLISGWRRLQALRRLHAETGEERFGKIQALLRRPDQASDAYLAMVEENEIRVGLSFYERARIAAKAVEQGVYPTEKAALLDLYRSASRPKRSKIRSFLILVHALDGALRFPEALSERTGLVLARAIENSPAVARAMRDALAVEKPADPAAEQACLMGSLKGQSDKMPTRTSRRRPRDVEDEVMPGLRLVTHGDGSLTLTGTRMDSDLRARLRQWLTEGAER